MNRILAAVFGRRIAKRIDAIVHPPYTRARALADIAKAPAPQGQAPADSHTLSRVAAYLGKERELTVKNDEVVCEVCGGCCGQCGWGSEIGLPYTATLPHLKAHVKA